MHLAIENCTQLAERCSPLITGQMFYRERAAPATIDIPDIPQPPLCTPKGQKVWSLALHGSLCHPAHQGARVLLLWQLPSRILFCKVSAGSGCCSCPSQSPQWALPGTSVKSRVWLQLEMMTDMAPVTGQDFQYFGKGTFCSLFVRRQSHPKGQI